MAKISFTLAYTKIKAVPPATAAEFEKSFTTLEEALSFCAQLAKLGGEPLYIVKLDHDAEASVLEGDDLDLALRCHRPGRNAA